MNDAWVGERGPARYYNEAGVLHREDGPAYITASEEPGDPPGTLEWWFEGERHRIGAPAVVYGIREIPALWFRDGDGYAGAETYISEWLAEHHPQTTWELDVALVDAVHPWVEGRTLEDLYQEIVAEHPHWDLTNWEREAPSRQELPGGGVRVVDEEGEGAVLRRCG